ncbi:hypothetical protein NEMIN01_2089 [Nematocida minor]|uniref:uncharacterized protein n=1 Tax=Nematocida minor TaxID=1912983 RepID=UPI00221F70ED|nr:uncharacterized protein NEMIN01_2089 [Nematocida minor]KAI5192576.1 hypothetical protein NEMIN01_2089 [Nematocida minor]
MSIIAYAISMLPTKTTIIQTAISHVIYTVQQLFLEKTLRIKMESGYLSDALNLPIAKRVSKKKAVIEILKGLGLAFAIQNVLLATGSATEASGDFITNYFSVIAQSNSLPLVLKQFVQSFKIFCTLLPILMAFYYTVICTIKSTNRAKSRKITAATASTAVGSLLILLMIGNYLIIHSEIVGKIAVSIFGKSPTLVVFNFLIFSIYSIAESICLSRNIYANSKNSRRNKKSLVAEGVYLSILAIAMSIATAYVGVSVTLLLNLFVTLTKKIINKRTNASRTIMN